LGEGGEGQSSSLFPGIGGFGAQGWGRGEEVVRGAKRLRKYKKEGGRVQERKKISGQVRFFSELM